ncbi:MAG: FHA domain-containing protein [Planctomycetes bacterium]|nr:FHA domain-containing protein [Planctomycetota bacterium]MBI3834046.1 FHA domain-containing protein [Planctomycetota bacterium]
MNLKLIVFRQDGSKREFPISPGTTTIGRKDSCNIRIPLSNVSRRHAEIVVEKETARVKDLAAANGTFLNNRRITEEELEAGDQLVIGSVVFTVQVNGKPTDEEIVKIKSKARGSQVAAAGKGGGARLGTSKHVYMSDEEVDPISALEALASSADQTAITPEEEE